MDAIKLLAKILAWGVAGLMMIIFIGGLNAGL